MLKLNVLNVFFIKIFCNFGIPFGLNELIYRLAYLLTYLITYLLTCLLNYLLTYLPTYLLTYLLTHLLSYLLTYPIEHSPTWETSRVSASQEIPRILWTPKGHCRVFKFSLPVPILNQINYRLASWTNYFYTIFLSCCLKCKLLMKIICFHLV